MSYYGGRYRNRDGELTKREFIVSMAIISIVIICGLFISGAIRTSIIDANKKYETAVQIENKPDQFHNAISTNYGDVLAEGPLRSVGEVTIDDVSGMSVRRVLEKYTRHTRRVSYSCGTTKQPRTCWRTEVYWTWDYQSSVDDQVAWVTFLDEKFYIGSFPVPSAHYVKTVSCGNNLRHVYYKRDNYYYGTIYTFADNKTINNTVFVEGLTVKNAVDHFTSGFAWVYIFWVFWVLLAIVGIVFFCYLPNYWLNGEDYDDSEVII